MPHLGALGRLEEAIDCYDQAAAIDPQTAATWFSKALAEEKLDRTQDAIQSYKRYIAAAPAQDVEQIEYARGCLRDLESAGYRAGDCAGCDADPTREVAASGVEIVVRKSVNPLHPLSCPQNPQGQAGYRVDGSIRLL